jgi:hypothetical protein
MKFTPVARLLMPRFPLVFLHTLIPVEGLPHASLLFSAAREVNRQGYRVAVTAYFGQTRTGQ